MSKPNGHYSLRSRPTSPAVLFPYEGLLYGLPTYTLSFSVEVNVATAFVKMEGVWRNIAKYGGNGIFVLPTEGTVTRVDVEILAKGVETGKGRKMSTVIVEKDAAAQLSKKKEAVDADAKAPPPPTVDENGLPTPEMYEEYIPGLFRLPIANVGSKELIKVSCWYMEPLPFYDRMYQLTIPLRFNHALLPPKKTMSDVLSIDVTFNSVSTSTKCKSSSHKIKVVETLQNSIKLNVSGFDKNEDQKTIEKTEERKETKSIDFRLSYTLNTDTILPTMVVDDEKDDASSNSGDKSFLLFVSPPSVKESEMSVSSMNRSVVFILDRSGSMTGRPYEEAVRALVYALENLKSVETFNIIAFDDKLMQCFEGAVVASKKNIQTASTWLQGTQPNGGFTDIMTPLQTALKWLEIPETNDKLPVIVLLTDGCVGNERDICRMFGSRATRTRIATFAIGKYANWFFLKMLSQIGHGVSDVCMYSETIYKKVVRLMKVLAEPLLTSVELDIPGCKSIEVLPNPIPDLFLGRPVNISGVFKGDIKEASLRAINTEGAACSVPCTIKRSKVIPVDRVLMQQRIDLLTAKAWLEESDALKKQVVQESCENEIPSAFTTMVLTEYEEVNQDEDGDLKKKKGKWYTDKGKVAAVVGGGAVLVGALAFSFGDVASTDANLGMLFGGEGAEGCCECCGDECGCDACCDACDGCSIA